MKQSHLDYFKSLIEGTANISWNAWFREHERELRDELPRAPFLRLKFKKLEEAEKYLQQTGVEYRKDLAVWRREVYYSLLHDSVLDDRGRPLESFQRKAYDGAVGELMDGNTDVGRKRLQSYIRRILRREVERRQQELEDLCFDGECQLRYGNPEIGRVLLEAVAEFPKGNDLTDFAVLKAESLLHGATS